MFESSSIRSAKYESVFKQLAPTCQEPRVLRTKQRLVTEFWPVIGESYFSERSFVVVGRAVNGWVKPGLDLGSENFDAEHRRMLSEARRKSEMSLDWVRERGNQRYNPRRSQFWGVVRRLHANQSNEWLDSIGWSNLYKLAPCFGGNPGAILRRLQFEMASKLLQMEIQYLRPKRLLFLTGVGWANPFLDVSFRKSHEVKIGRDTVEAGVIGDSIVVVGPHPQGRNISKLVAVIERMFASV